MFANTVSVTLMNNSCVLSEKFCASHCVHSPRLQWRRNERDGVSNHQPHDCSLNRLFRRRSKKISKLRVTGLCEGIHPVTGEFPAQRTGTADNVPIWWRHHEEINVRQHAIIIKSVVQNLGHAQLGALFNALFNNFLVDRGVGHRCCKYSRTECINSLAPGRSECDFKNVIFNLVLLIGLFRSS